MQIIIEARLVDDMQETARIHLAVIDRELTTSPLGLSLAGGKALLGSAQQYLVHAQCEGIGAAHAHCKICGAELTMKGWHERQIRTVFGRVKVRSPRVRCCSSRELSAWPWIRPGSGTAIRLVNWGRDDTSMWWPLVPASRTSRPESVPMS